MPAEAGAGKKIPVYGPPPIGPRDPLLQNFVRLLRNSYLQTEARGEGLEMYRSCAAQLSGMCGERWVQRTILRDDHLVARTFLKETGLPVPDPEAFLRHSLMANLWRLVWYGLLERFDRRDFDAICSVTGAEHLRAALAAGRGIVVTHIHAVLAPAFWIWLEHQGIPTGVTIWQWRWGSKAAGTNDPKVRTVESARELHLAMRTLREGGLTQILPDGHQGSRKVVLPFFNRQRGFEPTFVDLVLATGACIVRPVIRIALDGGISIDIEPPITDGSSGRDRAETTDALMRQYVAHLEKHWRGHPADIPSFQMQRHLQLPPV